MLSHGTTATLLTKGVLALVMHPGELAILRGALLRGGSYSVLIDRVVEELLRYVSPSPAINRWAFEDVKIGGKLIRKGDNVVVMVEAANRDPAQFPDPDRLDITRDITRHSAFGFGIHFCLGAAVARAIITIALTQLLKWVRVLELVGNGEGNLDLATIATTGFSSFGEKSIDLKSILVRR
jgi:cytochrome P450